MDPDGYQSYAQVLLTLLKSSFPAVTKINPLQLAPYHPGRLLRLPLRVVVLVIPSAPEVTVVGGPHLLRITDTSSAHYGRVFLITNNTTTTLDLDFSILANGETGSTSTFFTAGTEVEVVRAPTLGNVFGISAVIYPPIGLLHLNF